MTINASPVCVSDLQDVVAALASWQHDGLPVQLHPGDLGWHWRFGADTLAGCLRAWRDGDEILAVGFVEDDGSLIRLGLSPRVDTDVDFARRVIDDLADPGRGILTASDASVEARFGQALRQELTERGWQADEPWTPLVRDLHDPVEEVAIDVRVVGPDHIEDRVAIQRASFPTSTFTVERWHAMAQGTPYRQARCLIGYSPDSQPVATVTVWSAGPGRPGLLEPMGTHKDYRGNGYGRAITIAAAAALRELGSSSAVVATPTSNSGGVRTYVSAGFAAQPDVTDFRRPR